MSSNKRKAKGGAEKEREKKQKMLQKEAKKIPLLSSYFCNAELHVSIEGEYTEVNANGTELQLQATSHVTHESLSPTNTSQTDITTAVGYQKHSHLPKSNSMQDSETTCEISSDPSSNLFRKPKSKDLSYFFKYHPIQPKNMGKLKNTQQLFTRKDGTNRMWLTYSDQSKALFCSVCLAYATNNVNVFITGMCDLDVKHVYDRVSEHEASKVHLNCVDAHLMRNNSTDVLSLSFSAHKASHNLQVEKYRQVLDREIEILKLIGKRGLSYRGKRNETSSSLQADDLERGNFLELVLLVAKYDVVLREHVDSVQSKSRGQGRGSHLTFLSKTTVNYLLEIMRDLIKANIVTEIKECGGMFSILLDTTQDIAAEDQCSIVVRYAHHTVHERLIGFSSCKSTTGENLFESVKDCLQIAGLSLSNVIGSCTDGASNMQGPYNGFLSHISSASPNQVLVWCYAHVLNLVMVDATRNIQAANLFSLLDMCAVFLRESHKRMDVWKEEAGNTRRLGLIGSTRWWSKSDALSKIFGGFGDSTNALYVEVLRTLSKLEESLTGEAQLKASAIKQKLLSYEVILSAQIFLRIFQFTTPLSKYLQTKSMDILQAYKMVISTVSSLENISRDFRSIEESANKFVQWANEGLFNEALEVQQQLTETRRRLKKKQDGEEADDEIGESAMQRFKVDVHNQIFDIVTEKMRSRFEKHGLLFGDLACLDPKSFQEIDIQKLPQTTFASLSTKLSAFDPDITANSIKSELLDFASKWKDLKKNIPDSLATMIPASSDDDSDEEDNSINLSTDEHFRTCKNCAFCCYVMLKRYNLFTAAYRHLFLCYQYLMTLPTTQVSCERSFSKLKYIKNRLRSTLTQDHLESFMLMSMEPDILQNIPNELIINRLASKSTVLSRNLHYV